MSNSSSPAVTPGLAPMYGAPQTPTPVPVPQAIQEECIVTSSYGSNEQQSSRGYDAPVSHAPPSSASGPPQTSRETLGGGGYSQPQHYGQQQQAGHYGGQQQPLYHHQQPSYHQPGPVVQVQFTQQHPQPQPQQQHYQVHQLHPGQQHHAQHYPHHPQHPGQQLTPLQPPHSQPQQNRVQNSPVQPPQQQQQQYIQQQQPGATPTQQQPHQTPPSEQSSTSTPSPSEPQQQPRHQQQPVVGQQHPAERQQHSTERQQHSAERQQHSTERQQHSAERQQLSAERQQHSVERPQHPSERQQHSAESAAAQQSLAQQQRPVANRGQFYQMSPGGPGPVGPQQRFVTVRQSPGGPTQQVVQVVRPGPVGGQQGGPGQRFQLVQQQQAAGGAPIRQVVVRQGGPQQPAHQFQQANVIRPQSMRPGGTPVRYVVPVQLRPGGPMPVHMVRPGGPGGARPAMGPGPQPGGGGSPRQGVIQHTIGQQQGPGGPVRHQQYQRGYSPGPPGLAPAQGPWRGQSPGPPGVPRMVRPPGGQMPGQGGPMMRQQQYVGGQQPGQQGMTGEKIAYNVEHVFVENGVKVTKMPVEINGETMWVECVPCGGQGGPGPGVPGAQGALPPPGGLQDSEGGIMMDLGETEGLEIPSPVKPQARPSSSSKLTPPQGAGQQNSTYGRMPDLPTTPLPQGQVVGVATGEPPSIDSPPTPLAGGEAGQSPVGSTSGPLPGGSQGTPGKRIPGKLAMCKGCGFAGEDLSQCMRCKRKLPDDVKLIEDASFKPKPDSTEQGGLNKNKALRLARLPSKANRKRGGNLDEPVCIALSSDEEGDDEDNSRSSVLDADGNSRDQSVESQDENIVDGSQTGQYCTLACRSIRVGNYKVMPKEKIIITDKGVQIKVPAILNTNEVVTINITMPDVLKVLAHFGKSMPLLFLYISPQACSKVRSCLKMANRQSFFLDVQTSDETQKRITILPEKLTEENKVILKTHFGSNVQELEAKDANEILVRSSPKDLPSLKSKMVGMGGDNMSFSNIGSSVRGGPNGFPSGMSMGADTQVTKYCQYPPDGSGMVSVTNEDYNCLEAEQFLNDVIIDFYLKYLQHGEFKTIDQMLNRTHIFTTYFYKRLTTRPSGKTKAHPVEDNPNLSAAEKRYERVKKWTKKVNLFDKDFIIVPINEHAHWFVCIICFPGQSGCVRSEDGTPCETPPPKERARKPKRKIAKKGPLTIGSTTIIPLKGNGGPGSDIRYTLEDDGSDRDEAEASDDDMEDEDDASDNRRLGETDVGSGDSNSNDGGGGEGGNNEGEGGEGRMAIRRPCILIFDSLRGSSKARTCQTLRDYLTCEWKTKMVPGGEEEKLFSTGNMPGCCPTVQQQPNFSDCGIYLLQYVQSFFRDPIQDYNLPIKGIRQWFKKEEVEAKRSNIAELIRNLAAEQNPGKEFFYPDLNFTNPPEEGEEDSDEDDEDYDEAEVVEQPRLVSQASSVGPNLVRLSGGPPGPQTLMSGGIPGGRVGPHLLLTQGKQGHGPPGPGQGKVLIQKTGNQLKMTSLANIPVVPPGVTVTPAPGRLLNSNISIRKMNGAGVSSSAPSSSTNTMTHGLQQVQGGSSMRETLQTSPDSTSHEDSHALGDDGESRRGGEEGEMGLNTNTPDSQGFESLSGKRSSDMDSQDTDAKRIKSDSSDNT